MRQWLEGNGKSSFTLVTKHKSPDYSQLTGHIPKELARQFRVYCADQGLTLSEAMEIAVKEFLARRTGADSDKKKTPEE